MKTSLKLFTYLTLITLCGSSAYAASNMRKALCIPGQIMVNDSRIHVKCDYSYITSANNMYNMAGVELNRSKNHPVYFAVAANSPMASHFLAIAQNAVSIAKNSPSLTMAGKNPNGGDAIVMSTASIGDAKVSGMNSRKGAIEIVYDQNDTETGPAYGCSASDCRKPINIHYPTSLDMGD